MLDIAVNFFYHPIYMIIVQHRAESTIFTANIWHFLFNQWLLSNRIFSRNTFKQQSNIFLSLSELSTGADLRYGWYCVTSIRSSSFVIPGKSCHRIVSAWPPPLLPPPPTESLLFNSDRITKPFFLQQSIIIYNWPKYITMTIIQHWKVLININYDTSIV